jgi:NADH:ubiquinone oxidoreductase subunit F (NADH-binding)
MDIIQKLKENNLLGRGGGSFPTAKKWEMVKAAKAQKKYIICNGSEGEPGVFKDGYILKNYLEEVVNGIKIALGEIENSFAIYI